MLIVTNNVINSLLPRQQKLIHLFVSLASRLVSTRFQSQIPLAHTAHTIIKRDCFYANVVEQYNKICSPSSLPPSPECIGGEL